MNLFVIVLILNLGLLSNKIVFGESSDALAPHDAIHDAISVAKCRLRCIEQLLPKKDDGFTSGTGDEDECIANKDCNVCWKVCDYLQQDFKTWGEMCVFPHEICVSFFDGCIQACLYHVDQDLSIHYTATAVIDGYSFPTEPKLTGNKVNWQKVREASKIPMRNSANLNKKAIYSVLVAPEGAEWMLVGQTLKTSMRIEDDKRRSGKSKLMVIAVMNEGVVAVARSTFAVAPLAAAMLRAPEPVKTTVKPNLRPNGLPWNIPMASEIGTVMDGPPPGYAEDSRMIGLVAPENDDAGAFFPPSVPVAVAPVTPVAPDVMTSAQQFSQEWDWKLVAKSVTRNPVFRTVDAVVAWNAKPNRHGEYLVTWEVNKENFGVKGHVYTRNSSVTLNLNPEEVYRVQVEYISRAKQQSEASPVILVDTHNITSPSYWSQEMSNQVNTLFFRSKFEVVIMVLVGFCALLLTFVAFIIWRMKKKQIKKRMRAEMVENGRDSATSSDSSGGNRFDRASRSLLLSDHLPQRSVTPMTVSTATSPFEDSMFPKMFRFPSVTVTKASSGSDSSATETLLERSPSKKANRNDSVVMVAPFVHQSMPNIAPEALETQVTRFKNMQSMQMPGSRASVAVGSSNELPIVQNILPLKVPPFSKRSNYPGTLEIITNGRQFTSIQSMNEIVESR